jgi:hypothetical protein
VTVTASAPSLPIVVTAHAAARAGSRFTTGSDRVSFIHDEVTGAINAGRVTSRRLAWLRREARDAAYAFSEDETRAYVIQARPDRRDPGRLVLVVITAIGRSAAWAS